MNCELNCKHLKTKIKAGTAYEYNLVIHKTIFLKSRDYNKNKRLHHYVILAYSIKQNLEPLSVKLSPHFFNNGSSSSFCLYSSGVIIGIP